jgi:hypothetical protein
VETPVANSIPKVTFAASPRHMRLATIRHVVLRRAWTESLITAIYAHSAIISMISVHAAPTTSTFITNVTLRIHFFLPSLTLFPYTQNITGHPLRADGLSLFDNWKRPLSLCGSSFYV